MPAPFRMTSVAHSHRPSHSTLGLLADTPTPHYGRASDPFLIKPSNSRL